MKLDRNIEGNEGEGKYAILNLRKFHDYENDLAYPSKARALRSAIKALENAGVLEFGATDETEFFVIKLKDKHARGALMAYAASAMKDDPEFAKEVLELSSRSGPKHPLCQAPD